MLPVACSLTHQNLNLVEKVFKTDCKMCLRLKNLGMSLAHKKQMILDKNPTEKGPFLLP